MNEKKKVCDDINECSGSLLFSRFGDSHVGDIKLMTIQGCW